jgi:hypothetical protein
LSSASDGLSWTAAAAGNRKSAFTWRHSFEETARTGEL